MPIVSTADYTRTMLIVPDVDMARMNETEKETGEFACEKITKGNVMIGLGWSLQLNQQLLLDHAHNINKLIW